MANKIQLRRGIKANLPTLSVGEPAFCTDTKELYIGTSSGNVRMSYDTGQGVVAIDSDKLGGQLPSYYLNYTNFTNKPSIPNITVSSTDLTYYVSPTGNDSNSGTSSSSPFKTIAKAINAIPQIVNHIITINLAVGTYNEDVIIEGFCGSGQINIIGSLSALDTTHLIKSLEVNCNSIPISISGLTATTTTTRGFSIENNLLVSLQYCNITASSNQYGYYVAASKVVIFLCQASNRSAGIYAYTLAEIYSTTGSGTNNSTGLIADQGGTIIKKGTQPNGTTSETVINGGVIR